MEEEVDDIFDGDMTTLKRIEQSKDRVDKILDDINKDNHD